MFVDSATGQQFIASGMLRPIVVASKQRLATLPEVPTLIESGMVAGMLDRIVAGLRD